MADPYIGDIRMFAGTFAPRGYALCDGQSLKIMDYTPLFALIGTIYGGDGRTTFRLPDLRGRLPVQQGTGPGLPTRMIGYMGGVENVTLNEGQLPSHTHPIQCANKVGNGRNPAGTYPAIDAVGLSAVFSSEAPDKTWKWPDVPSAGADTPASHANVQPYQCINFIIALTGLFPSRN